MNEAKFRAKDNITFNRTRRNWNTYQNQKEAGLQFLLIVPEGIEIRYCAAGKRETACF